VYKNNTSEVPCANVEIVISSNVAAQSHTVNTFPVRVRLKRMFFFCVFVTPILKTRNVCENHVGYLDSRHTHRTAGKVSGKRHDVSMRRSYSTRRYVHKNNTSVVPCANNRNVYNAVDAFPCSCERCVRYVWNVCFLFDVTPVLKTRNTFARIASDISRFAAGKVVDERRARTPRFCVRHGTVRGRGRLIKSIIAKTRRRSARAHPLDTSRTPSRLSSRVRRVTKRAASRAQGCAASPVLRARSVRAPSC